MHLNDKQRRELCQCGRQAVGRVSERAHFVLLRDDGLMPGEIAQTMTTSESTVRRWLKRYDGFGVAGLHDLPRSGRRPIEPHLTNMLEAQASQTPDVYGYLQTVWTVALLALHLWERFRTHVSPSTVRRGLHAAGFRWKRPKLTPAHKHDPLRAEREARLNRILQARDAVVIAADECDVHLLAVLRAMCVTTHLGAVPSVTETEIALHQRGNICASSNWLE